jgi:hypothetical protein
MVPPENLSKKFVFSMCRNFFMMDIFRVSDPDPYWIRIQSGQWIRSGSGPVFGIRIQEGKNDPQKKK